MIIRRPNDQVRDLYLHSLPDERTLSIGARWLMAFMLTRPTASHFDIALIQEAGSIGRDKAYKLLSECVDAGFIDREEQRDPRGRVDGQVYTIRNVPRRTE